MSSQPPPAPRANSETELINYLEQKGYTLPPQYGLGRTKFRHVQKASRLLTIVHTGAAAPPSLLFTRPIAAFAAKWQLTPKGELPASNLAPEEIRALLDDFFALNVKPLPSGTYAFPERLKEVQEIIHRIAYHNRRDNHYELAYEDLCRIGEALAYKMWQLYGDKPTEDFQNLFAKAFLRRIRSLLNKHFRSKRRAAGVSVPLLAEMAEQIPEERLIDRLEYADRNNFLEKLSPAQRMLFDAIWGLVDPPPGLRRDRAIERLRYEHVKSKLPKSRLPEPRLRLEKLALAYGLELESLQKALVEIKSLVNKLAPEKFSDWNQIIEER